jgi:1-deoxy-D-xylulose-5-phosphate synthase
MPFSKVIIGTGVTVKNGTDVAIITVGNMLENARKAIELLEHPSDEKRVALFDIRFIKPLDEQLLHKICNEFKQLITIEDGVISGGFGSSVAEFMALHHYKNDVTILGIPDTFPQHGTVAQLQDLAGISAKKIATQLDLLLNA